MALFGLFGSSNSSEENNTSKTAVPWKPLTALHQLDAISETSKTKPVAIFKHSTRCGISRMVLRQFESSYNIAEEAMDIYYLDLLSFRDVSDEVGYRFQVMHQSPQLIVIQNGIAVHHSSHHSISSGILLKFV